MWYKCEFKCGINVIQPSGLLIWLSEYKDIKWIKKWVICEFKCGIDVIQPNDMIWV